MYIIIKETDDVQNHRAELDMDWIHPWIGLDWIGLSQDFEETLWIGLDWVR